MTGNFQQVSTKGLGTHFPLQGRWVPKALVDICTLAILRHVERYNKIVLPEELTARLLALLIEAKKLNKNTLLPFLHSSLRNLNLSGCQDINVKKIAQACTNLTTLSLRGCMVVNDAGLLELARASAMLKHLNLSYSKKISDSGINHITQACTMLEDLDLSWCNKLTDRSLPLIAKNCPQLRHLNCSNLRLLTGKGVKELCKSCTHLESLTFRTCQKLEHCEIVSASLRVLNLARCERFSEQSLINISCPSLSALNLSGCKRLTDAALDAISTAFHDLEALDLSYCNISTTCLLSPTLCNLYIYGCANLKEEFFAKLSDGCPQLTTIDLRSCPTVNDECIDRLTDGCSKLHHINLSRCPLITDAAIQTLALNCALLNVVDLSWCVELTDTALEYLWKGCYFIEEVKIFGCIKISRNSIYTMAQNLPKASVLCVQMDRDWCMFESLS